MLVIAIDVLATAHPVAYAPGAPHDLRQQSGRIVEPRQVVSVPSVVAEHEILCRDEGIQRNWNIFLPQAGMRRAVEFALREKIQQQQFESSNQ